LAPSGRRGHIQLDLYSDTNFAPDDPTRRAMTCGITFVDGAPYSAFARRQGVVSTSSGTAEFYGASAVAMDGKVVWGLFQWLGYEVECSLYTDSSAAKAMILRDGVGKVKHLDVRALWIQQERHNGLRTRKVAGERNPADLGTKAHPAARFVELRNMVMLADCSAIDGEVEMESCVVELGKLAKAIGRGAPKAKAAPFALGSLGVQQALQALVLALAIQPSATSNEIEIWSAAIESNNDPGWGTRLLIAVMMMIVAGFKWWWSMRRFRDIGVQTCVDEKTSIELVKRKAKTMRRSIATQSQTTYKWWHAVPRFVPLADSAHGCSL
jgi:hypothetical protein